MIRRKTILLVVVGFIVLFLITTNYMWTALPSLESELKKIQSIEEKIYSELKNLPNLYIVKPLMKDNWTDTFLKNIRETTNFEEKKLKLLWKEANSWVSNIHVLNISSPNLGNLLVSLKNSKILEVDVDTRGTQLKLLLTLQGNQQAVFKPKWYDKQKIVEGPVYAGKDRYTSEIIGFYLSVILKKPLCPVSVERQISLENDIIPVAKTTLLETSYTWNNKTCVYGRCFYCRKNDPICDDENSRVTGAVIFNINATLINHRSPWQRTYKKGKNAVWQEYPEKYCKSVREKISKKRLYDLIDLSIFDFLIQNGDRHHYETLRDTVIWLDNGKGLGNPNVHHIDILAPLYQCCILRRETWKTLLGLTGGTLKEKLENMPGVKSLITEDHLKAIEERLLLIFATIEYCKSHKKLEH